MAKSISLKVPTKNLIVEVEKAIALRKKLIADFKTANEEYAKAKKKFLASVPTLIKSGKLRADEDDVSFETEWRGGSSNRAIYGVRVTYKFGKNFKVAPEPEWGDENISQHLCHQELKELENALRLLNLTEEAMVSTSTYNAISQYL